MLNLKDLDSKQQMRNLETLNFDCLQATLSYHAVPFDVMLDGHTYLPFQMFEH